MKRSALRRWKLQLHCGLCDTEQFMTAEEWTFSIKGLCKCRRMLRPVDGKGFVDWKAVGFLVDQTERFRRFEKNAFLERVHANGYEIVAEGERKYVFSPCPHPDCRGLLKFRLTMAYERVQCPCVCKGCTVRLGVRAGIPTVKLVPREEASAS